MSQKTSHLELIQAVIHRMSVNSFQLKGWTVVLVSALFALAAAKTENDFAALAYFPALAFWILDGYFLHQERKFRSLYDHVRTLSEEEIDFSMDASSCDRSSWIRSLFSPTLVIFHGVVFASIVLVMVALRGNSGG